MGDEPLACDVVLVESEPLGFHREWPDDLAKRKPLQIRNTDLNDEVATRFEMLGNVAEAADLLVLRSQIHDRVEHEVGKRELPRNRCLSEIALRNADPLGTRLS